MSFEKICQLHGVEDVHGFRAYLESISNGISAEAYLESQKENYTKELHFRIALYSN